MCEDCFTRVTCVGDEYGFTKIPLETCATDMTCLGSECTSDSNPGCYPGLTFTCNDIGVFPDPFDCQRYHFCVPQNPTTPDTLNHYEALCDGSWGYHAGTTFCQTRLQNNNCYANSNHFPIELCQYSGQTNALSQNPTIYYICAQYSSTIDMLYPFQFVCPHGGTYNNFQCVTAFRQNLNRLMNRIM